MKKFFRSLRWRIALVIFLAGLLPALILHFIVVGTYENNLISQRTIEVHQRCTMICSTLGKTGSIQEALTDDTREELKWYSEAYGGRLLVINERYRVVLDTFSADLNKVCISDAVFNAFNGSDYENYNSEEQFLEFVLPIVHEAGGTKTITAALVFSSTTGWIRKGLVSVTRGMALIEALLLILLLILSLYLSYLIVRPIDALSVRIDRISSGNYGDEIDAVSSYTEIDGIMASTSHIIDNFRQMEQSQEEFVSNVSHELRTPMTSIRVLADSLIGQEGVSEDVYQEFLNDISFEIDRESRIIEDLLSMSRLGKASDALVIATVNINNFLLELLKTVKPIAQEREIEIVYESFRQVNADVDEMKLKLAFSNLVENAVKYNRNGGWVKVSLDADHEFFYLKVADNGVGIPEDAISQIFDRFYRVDKARSRDTGGTGLGLSITKTIVLLHYGIIKVESEVGTGSTFTVRIPLKHIAPEGGER